MNPGVIICVIVIVISIVILVMTLSIQKINKTYPIDYSKSIEDKPPPFYDYEYFQRYFDLPYQHFTTNVIQKVNWFFHGYPIIFICLKNNKEIGRAHV